MVSAKAVLLVGVSAVLWGLYWMPVHVLGFYGITGLWTAVILGVTGLIASLPFLLRDSGNAFTWRHALGALSIGCAFTLYAAALGYTDIVRVVLLFYLAPAWSTLIECVFHGRRLNWRSVLGLVLSVLGLIVIFRGELPLDGLGALGDWMALAAGLCWSAGSAIMFSSKPPGVEKMVTASFVGALVVAALCLLLLGEPSGSFQFQTVYRGWPLWVFLLPLGLLYLAPVSAITLWGATQIPPAMMSFLLALEVIAAVASSAFLLDQPFGSFEVLGTVLIISAAMVEFIQIKKRTGESPAGHSVIHRNE